MIKINKNIIIVFLLLSVFAVGTLGFVDTVESAKWKKFDSGKRITGNKYVSYEKGNDQIKVEEYKGSKLVWITEFKKTGSKIAATYKDPKGKVIGKATLPTSKKTLKAYYNSIYK